MTRNRLSRKTIGLLIGALVVGRSLLGAEPPRVLFDQGHGQRFLIDEKGQLHLSRLAQVMTEAGLRVEADRGPLEPDRLAEVDALVISGAFVNLQDSEIEAVLGFLQRGGRLSVMLHIGPPMAELLRRLGVAISNGVIRESSGVLANNPLDFMVNQTMAHPLTREVDVFKIYGSWALMPMDETGETLAQTGPHAWVDLNGNEEFDAADSMQRFGVIVAGKYGKGRFVVYGDDAIFQNRFLEGENLRLAQNFARWLRGVQSGSLLASPSRPASASQPNLDRLTAQIKIQVPSP